MSKTPLKPWIENVSLHPDVVAEGFAEDIFALDLGPLADGNKNVPPVYRDPEQFFRASYLTNGLRSLLADTLSRLSGGKGNRILKLVTPFGGGKSHTLAALLHAAKSRTALDVIPEGRGLPQVNKVRTAVFDGQFFNPTEGKKDAESGIHARTPWGWIACRLRGKSGYELLRKDDEARVDPGADKLVELLGDSPNLILLDEVLEFLIKAGGIKVGESHYRDQIMLFLKSLIAAVDNASHTSLIFSLQSSKRESLEYVNLLQTIDHLAARKDQLREPVEGNEVLAVIQRRLLGKTPEAEAATPVAATYQDAVTQMRRAYARSSAEQKQAEEDGIALRDRIRAAYPFHPALIDLMRERWAAIPDFQRTRGALRFLAACLRAAYREGKSRAILGPGDVPMHDAEVRLAFFKEVGQQADFQAVLEHDLVGANARAKRIDERRAKEVPTEASKRPATRLATAILMYSFGGLRRESTNEMLPPGIMEQELLCVCVGPDLDSTTAMACLKELKEQCLYLHFDGVRYCFKKDPNVTLLIEQEADVVARDEAQVRGRIKEMLESRLAGHRTAIVWPEKSADIPDKDPSFLVAYLPLEFGGKPKAAQETLAKELLGKYGEKPRSFRNGLGLAIPSADQIEILRRAVRYLIAVEQVKAKAKQHNLTDEQKGQLRERESTERAAAESAFLKLYMEVWLPRIEESGLGIEKVAFGGRTPQTTLNERKETMIHERVMELLTVTHTRVHGTVTPAKMVELFKLGEGAAPKYGIRTAEVVEGFYSFLGFTRLLNEAAIRKAVARGVHESSYGYAAGGAPELGPDCKYRVSPMKLRFGTSIAEDEVDLETGFIILPSAMPQSGPAVLPVPGATPPVAQSGATTPSVTATGGTSGSTPPPAAAVQREVTLSFSADRNKLYAAWQAIANLVDMAGKVDVSVHAESDKGFDMGKLQNGVLEPLREADLIE